MMRSLFASKKILLHRNPNLIASFKGFSTIQTPNNLILADANIFNPLPTPLIESIDYDFPIINVPKNIPVLSLYKDATINIKESPLEKRIFEVAIRKDIVHDVIRYIRHMRRQPKKTKRIGEISGSTKKPRYK